MPTTLRKANKLPVPTGDPWRPSSHDPATVPVPLPVIIVSVEGPYTERDRKLWNFLLHAVWEELEEKTIHELAIGGINKVFRTLGGDSHAQWIWESAERLVDTKVKWIRTEGDKRYKGVGHLLSAETDEEVRETGTLRFSFPALLVPILKDPQRFARLRTHFLLKLSGKYAVTLYELLESVANKEVPVLETSMEQLRQWLKVPEGKLMHGYDFRRFVLEPALQQLNANPQGAGFTVQVALRKEGRAIKWVRFALTKTKERQASEAKFREQEQQQRRADVPLRPETHEKAKQLARGWDIYALAAEWQAWASKRGEWPPANLDAAFLGFCKKRGPYPGR